MIRNINQLIVYIMLMTLSLQCANGQEKKKEIFVDVQFIPVGPIPPTAKWKKVNGGMKMVSTPPDELPPRGVYYKVKSQYIRLGCNINTLASPVRVPVASVGSEDDSVVTMKFYTRTRKDDKDKKDKKGPPEYNYHPLHTHNWMPKQKSLLFVLTKPFKSIKWAKPKVTPYNLTPMLAKEIGLVVINASQEQKLGFVADGNKGVMQPGEIQHFLGDGVEVKVALVTSLKGKMLPPIKKRFLKAPGKMQLLLTFPVTVKVDFRGFDYTKKLIRTGHYLEPKYIKPK